MAFGFSNFGKETYEEKRQKEEEKKKKKARKEYEKEMDYRDRVFQINVKLISLERKFKVLIEQERRTILNSRRLGKANPKAELRLKNAYYSLILVKNAQTRIAEIDSYHEMCKTINEMSRVFKMMNTTKRKSQKVKDVLLKFRMNKMQHDEKKENEGLEYSYYDPIDEIISPQAVDDIIRGNDVDEMVMRETGVSITAEELSDLVNGSPEFDEEIGSASSGDVGGASEDELFSDILGSMDDI